MNSKVAMFLGFGLLACSMQAFSAPPPLLLAPIPQDGKGLPPPRICNLGKDCLAMDPHPFELCQLSSKSCGDKLAEVLQVQQPKVIPKPAPGLSKTRR